MRTARGPAGALPGAGGTGEGLEGAGPGPQLQGTKHSPLDHLVPLTLGHWKPPTDYRPQHQGDKIYRYIYIIKRSPKWGRGTGQPGPSQ